ncbi:flagellar export protein FliJ [Candidatus Magnetaquicoccus inordinatus]|uniref:flagellar export protein FliJ n=1 Tax=Candidatus Magnetaquicoccus inordinatus TaxID=2496818 RepID=UPI00187D229A|nr:flagellar export protein FliJ [Candidatus Magnetaquicoccus inordinatus]
MANRFNRLVELRRIREESNGTVFARVLARLEGLKQDLGKLDQQTTEEQSAMRLSLSGHEDRAAKPVLAAGMMDDFLRGQSWRRQRLQQMIAAAQLDMEKAKEAWLAARMQLRQAEKLAEREKLRQHEQAERNEKKAMDMVGVLRNQTYFRQEGDVE